MLIWINVYVYICGMVDENACENISKRVNYPINLNMRVLTQRVEK